MVAIHIPSPSETWDPAPPPAAPSGPSGPRLVPPARNVRRLPDRATRIRRRRLAALVAVVLLIGLAVLGVRAIGALTTAGTSGPSSVDPAAADAGPALVAGTEYVVRSGDTLWSIAATIAPDDDPRKIVDELREANGGAELQVGQRLVLDVD